MTESGFVCPNCEQGIIEPRGVSGRKLLVFPGLEVELPATLELPTCDVCLDYSVPDSKSQEVKNAEEQALKQWQTTFVPQYVDRLCGRHAVTKRRVAGALGVTASYLSNIAAGDKPASATLLRLLHAFVAAPSEFQHALKGHTLDEYSPTWSFSAGFSALSGNRYIDQFGVAASITASNSTTTPEVDFSDVDVFKQVGSQPARVRWLPQRSKKVA